MFVSCPQHSGARVVMFDSVVSDRHCNMCWTEVRSCALKEAQHSGAWDHSVVTNSLVVKQMTASMK